MIPLGAAGGGIRAGSMNRLTKPAGSRPSRGKLKTLWLSFVLLVASGIFVLATPTAAHAATLPAGFSESVVFSGLTNPTVVRFASDGRVFVAEKSGMIKVFDNLADTVPPTVFADLRTERAQLLGSRHARDGARSRISRRTRTSTSCTRMTTARVDSARSALGSQAARRIRAPPRLAHGDGCVVSGRLSRLQADGDVMTGRGAGPGRGLVPAVPEPLGRTVEFGPDDALYASAGDGASFSFADYGPDGVAENPCGDPPGGAVTRSPADR